MDIEQKVEALLTDHPLLHNLRMHDVPSSDTAAEIPESAASKYGETDIYIKNNCASIIGACIYMSITVRNDITFAVGKLPLVNALAVCITHDPNMSLCPSSL